MPEVARRRLADASLAASASYAPKIRFGRTTVSAATVCERRCICPFFEMSLEAMRAAECRVNGPLIGALGQIDRQLDRLPGPVVSSLPVVHRDG